jgi:hypothetical protein
MLKRDTKHLLTLNDCTIHQQLVVFVSLGKQICLISIKERDALTKIAFDYLQQIFDERKARHEERDKLSDQLGCDARQIVNENTDLVQR